MHQIIQHRKRSVQLNLSSICQGRSSHNYSPLPERYHQSATLWHFYNIFKKLPTLKRIIVNKSWVFVPPFTGWWNNGNGIEVRSLYVKEVARLKKWHSENSDNSWDIKHFICHSLEEAHLLKDSYQKTKIIRLVSIKLNKEKQKVDNVWPWGWKEEAS